MTQETNRQAAALADMERLKSDMRVLSPIGIERVAWDWDLHERDNLKAFHEAEHAALQAIESAGQTEAWNQWRRRLFYEVEGRLALEAWRAEHQRHSEHAHKAERSAVGGALGVRPTSPFFLQVAVGRTSCDSSPGRAATETPGHARGFRPPA